jgi:hypothetical protein
VQFLNLKSAHLTVQTIFLIASHAECLNEASESFLLQLLFHLKLSQIEEELVSFLNLSSLLANNILD